MRRGVRDRRGSFYTVGETPGRRLHETAAWSSSLHRTDLTAEALVGEGSRGTWKAEPLRICRRDIPWVVYLIVTISLAACSHRVSARAPQTADDAVTLVLLPKRPESDLCCRVVTVNPGDHPVNVWCHLIVFDADGQLVYAGLVPGPPPGHRRSSGFLAPPGRQGHGLLDLPVDLARDRYRATCRVAAWHGAPPI